jgi:putative FmdB family regulatory protein
MPVYEYFCRDCHTKHEKLRPMREADAPVSCPTCNTQNSVRALSVFVMHGASRDAKVTSQPVAQGGCACGGACGCASKN